MEPMSEIDDPGAISGDESNDENEKPTAHLQASIRHQTHKIQFQALLENHANHEYTDDTPAVARQDRPDADLSLKDLVARKDGGSGILDPREYQMELFERAKAQNTIAVLDTGTGKTLIAVLLLKHIIQEELVNRANGLPPRISFFLVDSVALVFQQSTVLRNNIDQNVAYLFGAMGTDFWDQPIWDEQLKENMVIVCTADILCHSLHNAFIKMNQINLLVFDEAHHTKKEHAYARIVREFYITADPSKRPKIFGMTASPIDGKGDILTAATRLETLLDSQIATTSKMTLLRQIVKKPKEVLWPYETPQPSHATELLKIMVKQLGDVQILERVFRWALDATSELGPWCADQVWTHVLAEDVLPQLEGRLSKESDLGAQAPENAERDIQRVKETSEFVNLYPFQDPLSPNQLSPKVQLLFNKLADQFAESAHTKCIVFTTQRSTARTLMQLCQKLEIPNIRPGILVGVRKGDILAMRATFRNQFMALLKFRQGELNCLFATSVAEEGLDIPDCNLVVRFDLYNTLIQYVQSRGRARHADSTYAIMMERENEDHRLQLQEAHRAELLMKNFCETLPEDRLLHGYDHDLKSVIQDEMQRTYTIPSTMAKLTYRHAVHILDRYATSLQWENDISAQVSYYVRSVDNKFACEVILPEKSPIRGLVGEPASRKSTAKQAAAFDACLLLRRNNLLDDHFRSIYHRRLPAMRNARLAITSKKTNQYDRICKPSIWAEQIGSVESLLYATVITFDPSEPLARSHGEIILLTRKRLPVFPTFPVYLDNDIETVIRTTCVKSAFSVTLPELECLTAFTLSVFHDLFHKTYEREIEKLPYWIAPVKGNVRAKDISSLPGVIDWDAIKDVQEHQEWHWSADMSPESLLDRFFYDYWDGRCRYFPVAVDHDLRPADPPPSNVPRRSNMKDILNYSSSLSKASRAKFLEGCDWSQPVLQAEKVGLRRNFLDKRTEAEKKETRCCICPQPLMLSAIPLPIVASCFAFPAIISRLESYLVVLEGCQKLGLEISLELALEAFTKDSDSNEEHRDQQIHVERGMGKNYERLELLGDSFLKMATSISLFCQNPEDDEYDYHVNRMCLICNQNLFETATKLQVFKYIRSQSFSRNTWYPPGLQLLRGRSYEKSFKSESHHALANKTIADVCEALIGAAMLSGGGKHRFDEAVKAVGIFVCDETYKSTSWEDYRGLYTPPAYQTKPADGFEVNIASQIFDKVGYKFKYPRLLRSAFTHPSYPQAWAKVPCYQRLEFLGDALLELVCIENLFCRFSNKDEQWLTEHKMAMVSNKFLGTLAVRLGFHRHLQHFSNPIQSQITHFAEEAETAESESEGAVDYWLGIKDPPKCLPDMVEAYLGSIFVDSGFDYTVIETFFQAHIMPYFRDMGIYDTYANNHPTTHLVYQLDKNYRCIDYSIKAGELPTVDREPARMLGAVIVHGESLGTHVASSGGTARTRACAKALEALKGVTVEQFRTRYHCDCRSEEQAKQVQ
ncbi:uncharacterized protein PFLUO_LOCUS5174 [Penicillium psychrofluorescens]|uniref:uncharacterized protein n=1 Tax=Penicillium psychrofluorescens TaxID=3158075 RepID=UPI003CCDE04C